MSCLNWGRGAERDLLVGMGMAGGDGCGDFYPPLRKSVENAERESFLNTRCSWSAQGVVRMEVDETVGLGLGKGVQRCGRSYAPWEQILFPYSSAAMMLSRAFMPRKERLFVSLGRNAHWKKVAVASAGNCLLLPEWGALTEWGSPSGT